jgi:uncharacterized protein (TIGR03382 family)
MTDADLAFALVSALVLGLAGAPGLGGLLALIGLIAYALRHERRSGTDRRRQPRTRRGR